MSLQWSPQGACRTMFLPTNKTIHIKVNSIFFIFCWLSFITNKNSTYHVNQQLFKHLAVWHILLSEIHAAMLTFKIENMIHWQKTIKEKRILLTKQNNKPNNESWKTQHVYSIIIIIFLFIIKLFTGHVRMSMKYFTVEINNGAQHIVFFFFLPTYGICVLEISLKFS